MRSIIMNIWFVCFLCSGILASNAATHYVVPTNPAAANPYTSWGTAGTSVIDVVKAAMTNATTPRTVWVSNGVYVLTNDVTITNDVALRSVNGRDVTIFNGNALYHFIMQHTNCVLDGLTITNGYSGNGGGGIRMTSGGTVTNCLITDCVNNSASDNKGGGIYIPGTGIVVNTVIRGNICTNAEGGGGIALGQWGTFSTGIIENCIIEKNISASGHGGGIGIGYVAGYPTAFTIRNCLIRYNMTANGSYYGGGIIISSTNALVINCTIVSNNAWNSGGIGFAVSKTNTVLNCIIYSNTPANIGGYAALKFSSCAYSCSIPSNQFFNSIGTGNTTNNPGFINFAEGNYRFNRYSPGFNTGTNQDWMTNAVDLDGHARILHGRVDMGAYELFFPRGTIFTGR
ncbi:MAG: hypothetical protein L6437_15700 [Kiritimatiellae bacterium]|nr:hypothetical protein [Kiritimatiellia bacterium]